MIAEGTSELCLEGSKDLLFRLRLPLRAPPAHFHLEQRIRSYLAFYTRANLYINLAVYLYGTQTI